MNEQYQFDEVVVITELSNICRTVSMNICLFLFLLFACSNVGILCDIISVITLILSLVLVIISLVRLLKPDNSVSEIESIQVDLLNNRIAKLKEDNRKLRDQLDNKTRVVKRKIRRKPIKINIDFDNNVETTIPLNVSTELPPAEEEDVPNQKSEDAVAVVVAPPEIEEEFNYEVEWNI